MRLSGDEDFWRKIAAHTTTRNSSGAPWTVQMQVAALAGGRNLAAAVSIYTPGSPQAAQSTWQVVAVTDDGRLIQVRMIFEAETWDLEDERQPYRQQNPPLATAQQASSQRLADAIRMDIGQVRRRPNSFGEFSKDDFDFGRVHLKFGDGSYVDLGVDQTAMYTSEDREAADRLIDSIRTHTGL